MARPHLVPKRTWWQEAHSPSLSHTRARARARRWSSLQDGVGASAGERRLVPGAHTCALCRHSRPVGGPCPTPKTSGVPENAHCAQKCATRLVLKTSSDNIYGVSVVVVGDMYVSIVVIIVRALYISN